MIDTSHRWQKTALAAALALLGFTSTGAYALSLGRISVQSALGEPLKAEIDIPDINAEEAASLKARVASPDAFIAAGLEYNPALPGTTVSLLRRADGRAFLRLASDRPINDPFLDMILEASWSTGRIVRDYTMLFDPPVVRQAPAAPTLAQTSASPSSSVPVKAVTPASPAPEPARPAPTTKAATPAATPSPAVPKPTPKPAVGNASEQVTVKAGDNASKLATRSRPSGVSLDQMLVAMIRTNPDAFINGNLNRLRTGAVVNMPGADTALTVPAKEASQQVIALSKDFNEFRRTLATNAPKTEVSPADRKASGNIDAKVEDKKAPAATPDKLTLSKGSVQAKADEARIAKERADKDAAARAAEIAKNISDLKKLATSSSPKVAPQSAAPLPSTTASKPAVAPTVPVAVATAPVASAPVKATSAPLSAPVAVSPVSTPVAASAPLPAASMASRPRPVPAPVVEPVEPPGLVDELLGDPMVPAAAGGLLALLGGFAFYRIRERKKNAARVDSSFLESRLQPDSFFGTSGGQRVDTANDAQGGTPSSMVYSASQLDAADDVDPVAEADVYLAYGRDLQAEEILREALRHNPNRLAIHSKLMEIFAKRRDTANFQTAAEHAFKLAGADSPEWRRICELGLSIDPENALYLPGGATPSAFASIAPDSATPESAGYGSTMAMSTSPDLDLASGGVDLDLDLDFSDDEPTPSAISELTSAQEAPALSTVKLDASDAKSNETLDFDISGPMDFDPFPQAPTIPEPATSSEAQSQVDLGLAPDLKLPEFSPQATTPVHSAPTSAPDKSGMLEFDLSSLSLDLEPNLPKGEAGADAFLESASVGTNNDPLGTKLALADEFVSIGDEDGARALIEEVIAEATGELRSKAQAALARLS